MIRYWDYNPSYSHPGMPMSTPVPFNQFVIPRAPNVTMPQNQWVTPYVSNRRDSYGNTIPQGQSYQGGGGFSGGGGMPPTINPMSSPLTWGVQSAIKNMANQPSISQSSFQYSGQIGPPTQQQANPFAMMGMTNPSTWREDMPGYNQPAPLPTLPPNPYPQNQPPAQRTYNIPPATQTSQERPYWWQNQPLPPSQNSSWVSKWFSKIFPAPVGLDQGLLHNAMNMYVNTTPYTNILYRILDK